MMNNGIQMLTSLDSFLNTLIFIIFKLSLTFDICQFLYKTLCIGKRFHNQVQTNISKRKMRPNHFLDA